MEQKNPHLTAFLEEPGNTQAAAASLFGVSRSYMNELAQGLKRPRLALAFKIEKATDGKIPAASWLGEAS